MENVERALSALLVSNHRRRVTDQILERLNRGDDPEMIEILGQIVSSMGQNIRATNRADDPDWFKGRSAK